MRNTRSYLVDSQVYANTLINVLYGQHVFNKLVKCKKKQTDLQNLIKYLLKMTKNKK